MSVRREIVRAISIASGTFLLCILALLTYTLVFCPKGRLAARGQRHEPIVFDSGYRFAVPGESIFACTAPHGFGGLVFHDDFSCYCAPEGTDPQWLGDVLGGRCTVEKAHPTREDSEGICRHAHCDPLAAAAEAALPRSQMGPAGR